MHHYLPGNAPHYFWQQMIIVFFGMNVFHPIVVQPEAHTSGCHVTSRFCKYKKLLRLYAAISEKNKYDKEFFHLKKLKSKCHDYTNRNEYFRLTIRAFVAKKFARHQLIQCYQIDTWNILVPAVSPSLAQHAPATPVL